MKIILRLIVLVVVALFIFTGGFWLGNKWKGQDTESPAEGVTAKLPEKEGAAPTEGQAANGKPDNPQAAVPDEKPLPDSAGTEKTSNAVNETAPPASAPPDTSGKETSPAGPGPQNDPIENSPESKQPGKAAQTEVVKEEKTAITSPAPEAKKETTPPGPEPEVAKLPAQPGAEGGEKKEETPPAIVTPQDLGENQITYSVQTGAFLDKERAENQLEMLKTKKYPAFMVSAWDSKKQLWHTVRVGRFTDIMEARKAAQTLQQKERIAARVYGLGSLQYEEMLEPETIPDEKPKPTAPKSAGNGVPETMENSG